MGDLCNKEHILKINKLTEEKTVGEYTQLNEILLGVNDETSLDGNPLNKENQTSSGSLKNVNELKKIELYLINSIETPFEFKTKSPNNYPTLVFVNGKYYCIDNISSIEDAKKKGLEALNCRIYYCDCDPADIELYLLIMKLSLRTKIEAKVNYSEIMAFLSVIKNKEMAIKRSTEDTKSDVLLSSFKKGGDRKSSLHKELVESDLISKIANHIGYSREHVKVIFDHLAYISDNLLDKLRHHQVKKIFYETLEPQKKQLINQSIQKGRNHEEIAKDVNSFVNHLLRNWIKNCKAKTRTRVKFLKNAISNYIDERNTIIKEQEDTVRRREFNPYVPEHQDLSIKLSAADLKTDGDLEVDDIIKKMDLCLEGIIDNLSNIRSLPTCKEKFNAFNLVERDLLKLKEIIKEGVKKEMNL